MRSSVSVRRRIRLARTGRGRRGQSSHARENHECRDGRPAPGPFQQPLDRRDRPCLDRQVGQPAIQVFGQGLGRGVAVSRALLQAFEHDRFEVARDSRIERSWPGRLLLAHLPQRLQNRIGPERRLAGKQLVEDDAERVDVDSRRDRLASALSLLGSHVARRPHDRARRGEAARFRRFDPLGQAEVGHQGYQAIERIIRTASKQDIGRLQVPVQDSALVSVMHGASHRRHQARGIAGVVPEPGGQECEIAAFDQLHAEIVVALVLTHLIDRDNMRMIEVRGGLGLKSEAEQVIIGREPPGPNHLECQNAIQADLASTVDHSHAPLRDHALQFVVAKILDVARAWLGRQTFTRGTA